MRSVALLSMPNDHTTFQLRASEPATARAGITASSRGAALQHDSFASAAFARTQSWLGEIRISVPFPSSTFIDGEGRTVDRCLRVPLVPVIFHDDVLAGEDIASEELTDVAVE